LIYNRRRFEAGSRLHPGERSIETAYDVNAITAFDEGVDLFEVTADLVLDFRNHVGFTSNGFYLEAFGGGAPSQKGYQYAHYGAEAIGYIDLYHRTRVLVLRAAIEGVEGDFERIPFSELPRLGGPDRLRGHRIDTYRDEKALLGSIEYHYPIHRNLAGQLFFDIGTVARNYPELFEGGTKDWKIGYGAGLLLGSEDSLSFRLDVSYGDALMIFLSSDVPHAFSDRAEEL
jgi:outer membrane protein assembly factor BamA